MNYGICHLNIVPLRKHNSDTSEMVSQVLFGECFKILQTEEKWTEIELDFDHYKGWICNKQYLSIEKNIFQELSKQTPTLCNDLLYAVNIKSKGKLQLSLGAILPFYQKNQFTLNKTSFTFYGNVALEVLPKQNIVQTAFKYHHSPYLWGGKSPFGIDCSGLSQMTYKLNGYKLLRDASQQATQGKEINLNEAESGDLAFFQNKKEKVTHVGIILKNNQIIHASGKVRIDKLDEKGIFNEDTQEYSHQLHSVRQLI